MNTENNKPGYRLHCGVAGLASDNKFKLTDCGIGFATLEAAQAAEAIFVSGNYPAARVTLDGKIVWGNRIVADWAKAALNTVGSPLWAASVQKEMEPLLQAAAFSFGDWRVDFSLEEYPRYRHTPLCYFELVISARNGSKEERGLRCDLVNASGSLQKKRFVTQFPEACAAWQKLERKPAPYHPRLLEQTFEQALGFLERFDGLTKPEHKMQVSYGSTIWRSLATSASHNHLNYRPGHYESPAVKLNGFRNELTRMQAAHDKNGCVGYFGVKACLQRQQGVYKRERLTIDQKSTMELVKAEHCCELTLAMDNIQRRIAGLEREVADKTDGGWQLLLAEDSTVLKLNRTQLDALLPLLANNNWGAIRIGEEASELLCGSELEPELRTRLEQLAALPETSRLTTASGTTAWLTIGKIYYDENDGIDFGAPEYVLHIHGSSRDSGPSDWLNIKPGEGAFFRSLYDGRCGPAECEQIRGHLLDRVVEITRTVSDSDEDAIAVG